MRRRASTELHRRREHAAALSRARDHVNGIALLRKYMGPEATATRWEPVYRGQPCSPDERRIVIATEAAFDARVLVRLYLTRRGVESGVVESVEVRRWVPRTEFTFNVTLLYLDVEGLVAVPLDVAS